MASVLVVDDDRDIREVLRHHLERAGHAMLSTASGAEALRLIGAGGIDLVLLDLGLPDVDGLDVLRTAHDDHRLPVLVLTTRSELTGARWSRPRWS